MRVLIMCLLATFVLGAALPIRAAELTVATFNAEFLTRPKVHMKFGLPFNLGAADEATWDQPGFRNQKFAEAAAHVAQVIATIDADVIALTEVGDERDLRELRDAVTALGVNYPHLAVCECLDSSTQQHVAVLSRIALTAVMPAIPGREGYVAEPDDPESEDDTRISKGMKVEFSFEGHLFHMYVLHLISERGEYKSDLQRVAQASIARRHMLPLLAAGEPVIVAGDLNDKRGQPTLLRIRGFDDIYPDLIQTGLVRYFEEDELDTRWTYTYQGERNQIDHVLLSPGVEALMTSKNRIGTRIIDHGNEMASDHRPVIVTMDLKD
ncbi:MAG: endonuclease/exonuclease/phosphatase family protein [Pontimonas sp.]